MGSADPLYRLSARVGAALWSLKEQVVLQNPEDHFFFFLKGAGPGEVSLGSGCGSQCPWLPLNVVAALGQVHSCCFLLLRRAELRSSLTSLLGELAAPTPSWLAWPVFVIVVLAPGQAWLGASLVGTVCTVSAEPSLSSYTINFFFF